MANSATRKKTVQIPRLLESPAAPAESPITCPNTHDEMYPDSAEASDDATMFTDRGM